MGKSLVIKGADFSINAIVDKYSIAELVNFVYGKSYPQYSGNNAPIHTNTNRCAFYFDFSHLVSSYSKIRMEMNDGYQFVFGIGNKNGGISNGKFYKGDAIETGFEWSTDYNYVEVDISATNAYVINVNLRNASNTELSPSITLLDMVKEIVLIP